MFYPSEGRKREGSIDFNQVEYVSINPNVAIVEFNHIDFKTEKCLDNVKKLLDPSFIEGHSRQNTMKYHLPSSVRAAMEQVNINSYTLNFEPQSIEDEYHKSPGFQVFKSIWFGRVCLVLILIVAAYNVGAFIDTNKSRPAIYIVLVLLLLALLVSFVMSLVQSLFENNYFNILTVAILCGGVIKTMLIISNGSVGLVLYLLGIFMVYRGRYLASLGQTIFDLIFFNLWQVSYLQILGVESLVTTDFLQLCYLMLMCYTSYKFELASRQKFLLTKQILKQQTSTRSILDNIFPPYLVHTIKFRLKNPDFIIASEEKSVSILFVDICYFWDMVSKTDATHLVKLLDAIYQTFDLLADKYLVQKLETVGKTYLACAGIPGTRSHHANACAELGLEIVKLMSNVGIFVKIGINTGRVISGVVGLHRPQFSLFGDTVNTASRMGSTSIEGKVQCSSSSYELIKDNFSCVPRVITAKGKGELTAYIIEKKTRRSSQFFKPISCLELKVDNDDKKELPIVPENNNNLLKFDPVSFPQEDVDYKIILKSVIDTAILTPRQIIPLSLPETHLVKYNLVPFRSEALDEEAVVKLIDMVASNFINPYTLIFASDEDAIKNDKYNVEGLPEINLSKFLPYSTADLIRFFKNSRIIQETIMNEQTNFAISIKDFNNNFNRETTFADMSLEEYYTYQLKETVYGEYKFSAALSVGLSLAQLGFEHWNRQQMSLTSGIIVVFLRLFVACSGFLLIAIPDVDCLKVSHLWMYRIKILYFYLALLADLVCPLISDAPACPTTHLDCNADLTPVYPHSLREDATVSYLFNLTALCNTGLQFLHIVYCIVGGITLYIIGLSVSADSGKPTNLLFFTGAVVVGGILNILQCYGRELYIRRAFILQSLIGLEKQDAEKFLLHMVPSKVAKKMIRGATCIAEEYHGVTILYSDIRGFTSMSSQSRAEDIVSLLSDLFCKFDLLAVKHDVYKDAYVVVSGFQFLKDGTPESNALNCVNMAISMHQDIFKVTTKDGDKIHMRIGCHTGTIVGGCIGTKKIRFDIWGEDALVANLLESNGEIDCVHISQSTYDLVEHSYKVEKHIKMTLPYFSVFFYISYSLSNNTSIQTYLIPVTP